MERYRAGNQKLIGFLVGQVMKAMKGKGNPAVVNAAFAVMQELSSTVGRSGLDAPELSMGMSSDLEAAIAHGATHVRVGTAILGSRPTLR